MRFRRVLLGCCALVVISISAITIAAATSDPAAIAATPEARWFDPEKSGNRYVTLYIRNGTYEGYAMCNKFEGAVKFDDNTIDFGREVITFRNECSDPDIRQEAKFLSALAAVRSWRIDASNGATLILSSEDGVPIVKLSQIRSYTPF